MVPLAGGERAAFVAAFANAIDELPLPIVLALDDAEAIRDPRIAVDLDPLLRRPPQMLRLVIAGRADPGLSLHRLRLEGQLSELRAADLAFTHEEAAELFELAGLDLTGEQVDALRSRTAGSGAGLRLAALSLDAHPTRSAQLLV